MEKVIVFDFDGVIVESMDPFLQTIRKLVPDFSLNDARNMLTGNIFDERNQYIFNLMKVKQFDGYGMYAKEIAKVAPNRELVKLLIDQPVDKIMIVSSMNEDIIEDYLIKYKLKKFFGDIWGAMTDKSKLNKIERIKALNPGKEVVFVTDTTGDIEEVRETKIKIVGVTWGFHTREMLEETKPDWVVDTPKELWKVLG